jgi:membrane-associated protease RseP (regulator of RpoE activity)
MNTSRVIVGCALAGCLAMAWPAIAQEADTAGTAAQRELEQAEAARALADAQRRLDEAAREVAELSLEMSGPVIEEVRKIRIEGPGKAMLGVNIDDAGPGGGVKVVGVSPGGPAAEAGVKSGDVITSMDGKALASGRDLVAAMRGVEPGQTVRLELRRDGQAVKASVVARPREEMMFIARGPGGHMEIEGMPPMAHFMMGPFGDMELVSMTPGLGRYFGTEKGLLVVRAPETKGDTLEDGDVILAIGGREPQNPGHALRILGSYQPGETVEVRILRRKAERTVTLRVPERHDVGHHLERRLELLGPPPAAPAPPKPPASPAG